MQVSINIDQTGLKREEVTLLELKYGKNEFSAEKNAGFLRRIWDIVKEPMFLMLVIACLLYFVLGEIKEGY